MKFKIKDKYFEFNQSISIFDINYFLMDQIIGYENNIPIIKSSITNFKKLFNLVNNEKEFKDYYYYLLNQKLNQNNNIFKEVDYLYDFQKKAINNILQTKYNGYLLSLEQGLGKTLTSLGLTKIKNENNIWIVVPASLQNQWKDEINNWLGASDICIYNESKNKRFEKYKNKYKFNIISYETLKNDWNENLNLKRNIINSFMIFDEATKLKTKTTQLYKTFSKICVKNKFNLFLTGTPINNALQDIDNIIKLIDKKITNIWPHLVFEEVKVYKGGNPIYFKKLVGYENLDEYINKIKPIYFRRTKEQVAKFLPKKNIISIKVEQTPFHQTIKEEVINNLSSFQGFTLLQVLETGYENLNKSESENIQIILEDLKFPKTIVNPKLNVLKDLLSEINNQVLIFSRFKESCSSIKSFLQKEFKDKKIEVVSSETKNKDLIATKFKNGEIDFVIATDTWAKGISFPDIDYLINFDISASYEMYFQKQDRIHRINSTTPKFIYNLVGNIVEEHIMELLTNKIKLAELITEGKAGEVNDVNIKDEVIKKLGWK